MAIFNFDGNQVAEFESIDADTLNGEPESLFGGVDTLPANDTVSIEIDDALINADGTFDTSQGDIFIDKIILNGVVIATDIKLKIVTGDTGKEFGDTFFVTDDAVDLLGNGETNKLVFATTTTFSTGVDVKIPNDSNGDGSWDFDFDYVCFAVGTNILTSTGSKAIEDLKIGETVWTLDRGFVPIAWMGKSDVALDGGHNIDPPVLIKKGALGPNCPTSDLIVSSQHRILVGSNSQLTEYFDEEVLVPAKSLIGVRGIRYMKGRRRITWVHIAFKTHEVVRAEGSLSESLLLGPVAMSRLGKGRKSELEQIFGKAREGALLNGNLARKSLRVGEVRRMVATAKRICSKMGSPKVVTGSSAPTQPTAIPLPV